MASRVVPLQGLVITSLRSIKRQERRAHTSFWNNNSISSFVNNTQSQVSGKTVTDNVILIDKRGNMIKKKVKKKKGFSWQQEIDWSWAQQIRIPKQPV
jgi:hypothetical protein